MRNRFIIFLLSVVLIFIPACSISNNNYNSIDFTYLYTGFVSHEMAITEIHQDVIVIKDQESWNEFKEKYIGAINFPYPNYKDSFDFNNEYLVYYQSFGARPNINVASKIEKLYMQNDYLVMSLEQNENLFITVEYKEPQIFSYLILVSIKKESVPMTLKNYYMP